MLTADVETGGNPQSLTNGPTPASSSNEKSPVLNDDSQSPPAELAPPRGWKWVLVLSSILSSLFLFALDNSIVADIQPAIVERFHSVEKLPWLSVAFTLGAASTCLVW